MKVSDLKLRLLNRLREVGTTKSCIAYAKYDPDGRQVTPGRRYRQLTSGGYFAKINSGAGANPRHSRLEREPLLRLPPVTSPVRAVPTLVARAG